MKLLPLLALFVAAASVVPAADSLILIEDTFTLKPGVRDAASDLAWQSVEKGTASWKRSGNLALAPEGWVTASGTGGSVGVVHLPALAGAVSLEADLNPAKSGFIALGFMEQGDLNFWNDTPLWMSLWPNGRCEVRAGKETLYTIDKAPGYKRGEFNRVALVYDTAANTASLALNGLLIVDRAALSSTPAIGFACFRFQEPLTAGIPALDNFRVSQNAAASTAPAAPVARAAIPTLPPQSPMITPTKPIAELIGQPLWASDIVTNEPLLFIDSGDGPVARLLFAPSEILSIHSADHRQSFDAAAVFQFQPGSNVITLKPGAPLPSLTLEELFPAAGSPNAIKTAVGPRSEKFGGNRWLRSTENTVAYFSKQVVVTYRHKDRWSGYQPAVAETALPRSLKKLRSREPFKLMVLGDSISAGCFASANLKSPPLQPSYPRLVADRLKHAHGGEVTMLNISKGGQVANYALAQIPLLVSQKPDLVILAFGMNDGSGRVSPDAYASALSRVISEVRRDLPETEFILVSTILGNPEWSASAPTLYPQYRDKLAALAGPGVALADVTALSADVLKVKAYADITVNGVNHPNDFAHRLYAQAILGLLDANR